MGTGTQRGAIEHAVHPAHTVVLNNALTALGAARQVPALDVAFKRVMASSKANSHTWASLFGAYANAGRPDLAVAQFEQACRKVDGWVAWGPSLRIWVIIHSGKVP
eukprot:scaffold112169_cov21-Tisochrysis_lutea.AAC.2